MAPLVGLTSWLILLSLTSNASTRQSATIVLSAHGPRPEAQAACSALDVDFLRYLDYDKSTREVEQYWVGSEQNPTCRAITTFGKLKTLPCDARLPALCSQSAPLSSLSNSNNGSQWQTTVQTGEAAITGYRDKLSFRFLGLKHAPYPSRFTYSTYQAPGGNVSALEYGPRCIQAGCNTPTCSEDCLYLNIWTPHLSSNPNSSKKSVMLFIHGGFTSGSGSDTVYDGGNMASRGDVVVVTINYRLSTLGCLAVGNTTARGTYWLSDQVAALEWVQIHIEDFGGDKSRVTVVDQSAGSASVRALLAAPPDAINSTQAIFNEKDCTQPDEARRLACLRALDPTELISGTITRYPVLDGEFLTTSELVLDGSGSLLDVAIMTGVMRNDGGPFTSFAKDGNASQVLINQGYDATTILSSGLYPPGDTGNTTLDIFNLTQRVTTNAMYRCLTQSTAFAAAKNCVFPPTHRRATRQRRQRTPRRPQPAALQVPQRRDFLRLRHSQYLLDSWTAFGRTRDPNPQIGYMRARGYVNTSAVRERATPWFGWLVGLRL
ncbi:alpha/beta-hydrolase [Bimuria novae-zelandiae CBS 107.79]|uniref:Alpha/beta-hydrolase n=1 Tax=Bimuria novae-zelandiae CBS 107.79 TaxID=1447943 RepID=A0A6A5VWP6_9PLEO|nr:alpha/beta-hydrolase [Bimuria novae-zelandiae CBS 107.79]